MSALSIVREDLLHAIRVGDSLRGGDWEKVREWHSEVVIYVLNALGDEACGDVANRLRLTRGETRAEKEYNAVGFVNDWLGTQVIGLTEAKVVPGFDGTIPEFACENVEPVICEAEDVVMVQVEVATENENGDIGPSA